MKGDEIWSQKGVTTMHTKWSAKLGLWPLLRNLQPAEKLRPDVGPAGAPARSDLPTTIALILIALLLALNFILRFPDLGAIIAQYNQF
jgi:hypothetical protein